MKNQKVKNSVPLIGVLLWASLMLSPRAASCAQDPSLDGQIARSLKTMKDHSLPVGKNYDEQKVSTASSHLRSLLLTNKQTALSSAFKRAGKAGLVVCDSADKKLRIICWDMEMGGTAHYCDTVAIYRTKDGVKAVHFHSDPDGKHDDELLNYDSIKTIPTKVGDNLYLLTAALPSNLDWT